MSRLIEGIERVLMNDSVIGWVDAVLLCMGLTCTVASAAPALQRIRSSEERS